MAWGVEIQYLDADSSEELALLSIGYYIMANGAATRLYEQAAWCDDCRRFVRAEYLSTSSSIDEQIAKYRAKIVESREALGGWLYKFGLKNKKPLLHELSVWDDAVAELQLAREWRLARQGPPRCLECGSTKLLIPPEETDFSHPDGKGKVRVTIASHIQLFECERECYTSEGLRIQDVHIH